MLSGRAKGLTGIGALAAFLVASALPAQQVRRPADPNQKICQVITPVGSRVSTKKICATRAEWEERKKDDRAAVEKAQTQKCMSAEGGPC